MVAEDTGEDHYDCDGKEDPVAVQIPVSTFRFLSVSCMKGLQESWIPMDLLIHWDSHRGATLSDRKDGKMERWKGNRYL